MSHSEIGPKQSQIRALKEGKMARKPSVADARKHIAKIKVILPRKTGRGR
jgi:hypothetical protein